MTHLFRRSIASCALLAALIHPGLLLQAADVSTVLPGTFWSWSNPKGPPAAQKAELLFQADGSLMATQQNGVVSLFKWRAEDAHTILFGPKQKERRLVFNDDVTSFTGTELWNGNDSLNGARKAPPTPPGQLTPPTAPTLKAPEPVREADPVEGRWEFNKKVRVLGRGGAVTDDTGRLVASWNRTKSGAAPEYEIKFPTGNVQKVALENGGLALQGRNSVGNPILGKRLSPLPASLVAANQAQEKKAAPPAPAAPSAPAAPRVNVPQGPEPSPDFVRLLTSVNDPWLTAPGPAPRLVEHMPIAAAFARLGNFDGGGDDALREVVGKLRAAASTKATLDGLKNGVEHAADNALDASRYNTTTFTSISGSGQMTGSRTEQTGTDVNDVLGWMLARGLAAASGAYGSENALEALYNATFTLAGAAPRMYRVDRTESKMIATSITRQSIAFTNTSGHDLTDLTLYVQMVHFSTAPEPFAYRLMYVPLLKAGDRIYVSPEVSANYPLDADQRKKLVRPMDARTAANAEEEWLLGSGGIVETRVSVWSREAVQNHSSEWLSDVASKAASYEMRAVHRVMDKSGSRPLPKVVAAYRTFVEEGSRRVVALARADRALTDDAQGILKDVDGAMQRSRDRVADHLRAAVEGRREGRFTLDDQAPRSRDEWQEVKNRNGEGRTALEISVIPQRNNLLVAYVYDPDHADQRRMFVGSAPSLDEAKKSVTLRLASDRDKADLERAKSGLPPEAPSSSWAEDFKKMAERKRDAVPKGGPPPPGSLGPDKENFNVCVDRLKLDFEDDKISGEGTARNYRFHLNFPR